ncbi:MAG TPA: hypothetical protein VFI11_15650 [Anaerolineales bacterium]|nr:hypothetical protein [Anaerolineales bacterium]
MTANFTPRSRRTRRSGYILLSLFLATIGLIGYVWWPLLQEYLASFNPAYPWWRQVDFLLVGIFIAMSVLIVVGADLGYDPKLALVGLAGGLMIESWGTQTQLWTYYTSERPPLWILPAWPIAALSIDRIVRGLNKVLPQGRDRVYRVLQLGVLGTFVLLMVVFVWPTRSQVSTLASLALSIVLMVTPPNSRTQLLTFLAGAGLGYFLERWGTTRACWTYYTGETPPFFAVLAHGMAAVAFWRAAEILRPGLARAAAALSKASIRTVRAT